VFVARAASPRLFRVLLLAGLVFRCAGLPLRGTDDMDVWKLWTHAGSIEVSTMYGVGGDPPERAVLVWGRRSGTVEYPPATLFALAAVGHIYRAIDPYYTDGVGLTVLVKLAILLGDVGVCLALWHLTRRQSAIVPRAAVLFYWLNPAVILDGAVLGYLDPWLGALTMAALAAIDRGRYTWAGVALALAALTKLQIILVLPFAGLLVLQRTARGSWWRAGLAVSAGAAATTAIVLAPFIRIGALPNLVQGAGRAFHHDMLSAEAVNVWWILTWILRGAWTTPVRILGISRVVALGYPNPRLIGTAIAGGVMLWAVWRARRASLPIVLAAGAFAIHAYTMFSVQVHENHFYLALPLMAAALPSLPVLRGPYILASVVCLLNMLLFQGFGHDFVPPPRMVTIVDATVLLSFVNIGAFAWHARGFARVSASHQTARPAAVDLDRGAADVRRGG
jgi:hypothetical protein